MKVRHLQRRKQDLIFHAETMERECSVRESMVREHAFERDVVAYLKMYHSSCNRITETSRKQDSIEAYIKMTDIGKSHRENIVDEYLMDMKEAPPKVAMAVRDECPSCDVKLLHCAQKSTLTCPTCGYSIVYLDATSNSTGFYDIV